MNERENRDDIAKRVIEQEQKWKRRLMTPKEKEQVVEYVKKKILPRVYEPDRAKE
jgi:hypothetical protein